HDEPPAASGAQHWVFFPDDDVYPQCIADPLRPQSAVILAGYPSSDIPDSGNQRFLLRLGGRPAGR
ncbi:MAG TPA: hypothetical protein VFC86_04925, partial [Planctomycetota bacterium]|nr:hypothetical protein [Planctomycetota bacterium]